ncbi:MAG: hypothetical protein GWN79_24015 [Actinobacteria bacterium]|nr:hypothetical protein [Actinomycetota bacterium]NIT98308.1 hypothetical protein [Actinomycetota bacterium]NIU21929.1 hypothetical protein [Actinomycetota bacterium]NIU70376.1 hypothetical protein [Actinomycetota bacterium]NIV58479.1 hypothetical protein [Actinomycetota bacterium]
MGFPEVVALLHRDERCAGGVADDANPVPAGLLADQLVLDVGEEHDLGPDRSQRTEGCVLVVGFASGDGRLATVLVLGAVLVAHQVDHPHRPVVLRRGGGEPHPVVVIDPPVPRHCTPLLVIDIVTFARFAGNILGRHRTGGGRSDQR